MIVCVINQCLLYLQRKPNKASLGPVINIIILSNYCFMLFYFDNVYTIKLHIKGIGSRYYSGGFRGGSGGSLEPPSGTKLFQFHGEIYEKSGKM